MAVENSYKVRLIPLASMGQGSATSIRDSQVVFDVTPTVTETGSVEYTPVTPVHMPGALQVYKHTNPRQFEITAHLISRNQADAIRNMKYLQLLRAWRYPYFGMTDTKVNDRNNQARTMNEQQAANQDGSSTQLSDIQGSEATMKERVSRSIQLRGAPPDVLYFYAYNNNALDNRNNATKTFSPLNISRVPVVLTNYSLSYADDVDYIPVFQGTNNSAKAQPWPVKMDVSISLAETHSPAEMERFDLNAYKQGRLAYF